MFFRSIHPEVDAVAVNKQLIAERLAAKREREQPQRLKKSGLTRWEAQKARRAQRSPATIHQSSPPSVPSSRLQPAPHQMTRRSQLRPTDTAHVSPAMPCPAVPPAPSSPPAHADWDSQGTPPFKVYQYRGQEDGLAAPMDKLDFTTPPPKSQRDWPTPPKYKSNYHLKVMKKVIKQLKFNNSNPKCTIDSTKESFQLYYPLL